MRISVLGAGAWGTCLASLLASKNYQVTVWTGDAAAAESLQTTRTHPKLKDAMLPENLTFVSDLSQVLKDPALILEAVTASGLRPVLTEVNKRGMPNCPFVISSKGIEQGTGMLLPEVALELLGEAYKKQIGCLCGPSHAEEVIAHLPTSVVGSAYDDATMHTIAETFTTPHFRVYPNSDIFGVAFGAAMKNVIAIACGISDGIGFGDNTKAALMTRGLHEIRKLAVVKGCRAETLYGLAGMGDLCVTCMSPHSRNYQFGLRIARGLSTEEAKEDIGMVVEGAYTALSAYTLAQENEIPLPITEAIYRIIYEGFSPKDAVSMLMERTIKEEHL